ncbi:MAG: hypothetical protein QGG42_18705 [Phycisphaerae bacterium]|jgi:hypothetical protein|nr:hypothetical protein [Phycisphaerae bacterium]
MLAIQILALFIAWGSATFGIWSSKKLNRKKAWIATSLTSLGLATGAVLAIMGFLGESRGRIKAESQQQLLQTELSGLNQKYTDQKIRAETLLHQLRLSLTDTELTNLEVQWVFHDVPPAVMNVFALGDAIDHANLMGSDDIDRAAASARSRIRKAWHIANVLVPLVGIVSSGETELKKLYEGKISDAINAFRPGSDVDDVDEKWFSIDYKGPIYNIMIPLNMHGSAALALGRIEDDRLQDPKEIAAEVETEPYTHIALATNFGFKAEAVALDDGFVLSWKYNAESLRRASVGAKTVAALPIKFRFIARQSSARDYIEVLRDKPFDHASESDLPVDKWVKHSEMTIIPNGIEEAGITYTIERIGVRDRMVDAGAYSPPLKEYEYTLFEARRKLPGAMNNKVRRPRN